MTCGHPKHNGEPCSRETDGGKCWQHDGTKDAGGRPSVEFTPEQVEQVRKLAPYLNQTQLAHYFEISPATFRNLCDRQPEVLVAYQNGRAKAVRDIAKSLLKKARDGNMTAMIFYLKTQARWSEMDKLELTGKDGGPIPITRIEYGASGNGAVRRNPAEERR